jgi:hypothetical protein
LTNSKRDPFSQTLCCGTLMLSAGQGILLDDPTTSIVGHIILAPSLLGISARSRFKQ